VATTQNEMKKSITIFFFTLVLSACCLPVNAQTTIPKGKAQLIEFSNANAQFTVPAGKTWVVNNVFSNYDRNNDIKVYIKSINGAIMTDLNKKEYGTLLYHSRDMGFVIQYPIILPENTRFELIVISGGWDAQTISGNKAFFNYTEVDN
jgi:hypothetical protein|tara:strand:+ start:1428 stop:1874 length:447 start_codon:yes stop_codon:yes gene_type:complete